MPDRGRVNGGHYRFGAALAGMRSLSRARVYAMLGVHYDAPRLHARVRQRILSQMKINESY
jgi:hypothetical protein